MFHDIEPFTYWKNDAERRVFLLADCPAGDDADFGCVLIEWGKTRNEPIRLPITVFKTLILNGKLKRFTPEYQ